MNLERQGGLLTFWSGDRVAGVYRADDPIKPHLCRLLSPDGHAMIVCRPHDHLHHKGVLFGLCTETANFWEEHPDPKRPLAVGCQRPRELEIVEEWGPRVGFEQRLSWIAGEDGPELFRECRRVFCSEIGESYAWKWQTRLECLADVGLTQSPWSQPRGDGTLVNYHGLGIRLRRDFSGTGGNTLRLDGEDVSFPDALGRQPAEVEYIGCVDETWPVHRVSLTLEQTRGGGLFVLENPFAYIGVGPSNLAPQQWEAGSVWEETYRFTVRDIRP